MTTPDWLTQHGGEVRVSKNGLSLTAYVGGQPQYLLMLAPVDGKYGCKVVQSNNGKRLDGGASFPTTEAAFQGGLDDLRKASVGKSRVRSNGRRGSCTRLLRQGSTPPSIRPA